MGLFLWIVALNAAEDPNPSRVFPADSTGTNIVPVLSPVDSLTTFRIDAGLRIELVASEPMVQDPVAMVFDARGRLWVVEMRGFMPTIDREGENEPVGRVSILSDSDADGVMDTRHVFVDGLVLPRSISVVSGGALVAEQKRLWFIEDKDDDGRSDGKRLVDADYGVSGSPEHTANGLWRGLDDWHYNAKSTFRYRLIDGRWIRERTEFRGQWGISHDDYGRLFYNYNWSQLHADLAPPSYLSRNPSYQPTSGISVGVATNQAIFPIRENRAVNRGYVPGALDELGRLREFTSACAPLIYRGDALPREFAGNAFVCEPTGNLIKRNIIVDGQLQLAARFAEYGREFLASTDERFRPVFLSDGPDGALYVVDMYRGVIQHGAHMTPYLRNVSIERGMEQPIHLGRIYRIVPKGWKYSKLTDMSQASASELVAWLSDANGWRRDMAQRLLIDRANRSCLPALRELALRGSNHLGRLHAIWTMHGLNDDQHETLLAASNDPHPRLQAAAIRVLEQSAARDPQRSEKIIQSLNGMIGRVTLEVRLQIALSLGNLSGADRLSGLERIISEHADLPIMRDAVMSSLHGHEFELLTHLWQVQSWQTDAPGRAIFMEALASATARSGRAEHVARLLEFLDRPANEISWRERALLAGLSVHANQRNIQPIPLPREPGVFAKWANIEDRVVRGRLEKLGRILEWPGHQTVASTASESRPLSGSTGKLFVLGRQQFLTTCAACHGADGAGLEPLGPPLHDSPWVLGSSERLVRVILHGLEGPIDVGGTRYEPPKTLAEMPSLAVLDNESIAAVLTYIRREWNHDAEPVLPMTVSRIRTVTQGRQRPWTQAELEQFEKATRN